MPGKELNYLKKKSRLQFTEEERASPELKKPIQKAEKAADRVEQVKKKARLQFEGDAPKPPSKLSHEVQKAPGRLVSQEVHRNIRESEDENAGIQASHVAEQAAETALHMGESAYHAHKLKPQRELCKAEHKLDQANADALYRQSIHNDPHSGSNPMSRYRQKQAIKKQYVAAKYGKTAKNTSKTTENTTKAAKKAAEKTKQAGQFVWRHKKGFAIAAALFLMLAFFLNGLSSCSVLLEGAGSGIVASTYPSQDADMRGAEAAYCDMEAELQEYLDNYERTHDYDEYHFDLDDIEHDPYVLISILTALHQGEWTLDEVQGTLQMLFEKQYILTEDVVVETRYRTETRTGSYTVTDPETGETSTEEYEYEVQVPYDYYICTVTLENFNLSHVPVYIMGEEQLGMYATYMATLGNRPDLFPGSEYIGKYAEGSYTDYEIPPEALEDEVFAAIITEAEKYLGYPYVWGGSSPSTSFDCSGFVSWVINHSGWDVGRLGAQGLCNICTRVSSANVQPGDLVFFTGTYDTPGVSHVGIYVGNGMMIHCGDPISYANLNSSYWQSHFYCYGRLP